MMHGRRLALVSLMVVLGVLTLRDSDAATRLGLHVTQEELNCWRQRAGVVTPGSLTPSCGTSATNGVGAAARYRTAGDVQTNSPGDWTQVLSRAAQFSTNVLFDNWQGNTSGAPWHQNAQCTYTEGNGKTDGCHPHFDQGERMLNAAFATLLDPTNQNRASQVRTALLTQIAYPGVQWFNTALWPNTQLGDGNSWGIADYLMRIIHAWDYVRISENLGQTNVFSPAEMTAIDQWFSDAGFYWMRNSDNQIRPNAFPNRATQYATSANVGLPYPTTSLGSNPGPGKVSHYNCNTGVRGTYWPDGLWNNRASTHARIGAAGALINGTFANDAQTRLWSQMWFKEWVIYAMGPDGTFYSYNLWAVDAWGQGWVYATSALGNVMSIADMFARSGDTSLYDFSTSSGYLFTTPPSGYVSDSRGGPKSLLLAMQTVAMLVAQDGTGQPNWRSTDTNIPGGPHCSDSRYLIDSDEEIRGFQHVKDTFLALGNIYYQNAAIKSIYRRQTTGTPPYPAAPASNNYAWGGYNGSYPGILLMWGQLDGVVDPFNTTADTTPPNPPTGLTVTSLWPTQNRLTWTAPTGEAADGYRVRFCTGAACDPNAGTLIPTVGNVTTYLHTGLTPTTLYRYVVIAFDAAGNDSTPTGPQQATTQTPARIAHWMMDHSGSTTAVTDSVGGFHGTLCNTPTCPHGTPTALPSWIAGRIGAGAVDLDGHSVNPDYIRVPHNATLDPLANQDFTYVWWANSTQAPENFVWPTMLGKAAFTTGPIGFEVGLHDSDVDARWYAQVSVNLTPFKVYGCSNIAASAGWHQLAFKREGTSLKTYQDGLPCNTTTNATLNGTLTVTAPLLMGVVDEEAGGAYNGALDDVQLYNFALSDLQVQSLFSATATLATTHFRFHVHGKAEGLEWVAAEDEDRTIRQNGAVRLRWGIQNTGSQTSTQGYPLQCRQDAGSYTTLNITCPSPGVCMQSDPGVTDGQAGTNRLTNPGGSTFTEARFVQTTSWPILTLDPTDVGELEYTVRLLDVAPNVVVCCRPVQADGTPLSTYPDPPGPACLTVTAGSKSGLL